MKSGIVGGTGQLWKGVAGILLMLIGLGLIYWLISDARPANADTHGLLLTGGLTLAIIGVCYPMLAVRCPKCGDAWVWRAMRRLPHRQWLQWLLAQDSCPRCATDF
jgi:hypothetical protein